MSPLARFVGFTLALAVLVQSGESSCVGEMCGTGTYDEMSAACSAAGGSIVQDAQDAKDMMVEGMLGMWLSKEVDETGAFVDVNGKQILGFNGEAQFRPEGRPSTCLMLQKNNELVYPSCYLGIKNRFHVGCTSNSA